MNEKTVDYGPRNGRPTKQYKESLRGMSRKDYIALEKACVEAYLRHSTCVILALPYLAKLPADFPPTAVVRKEGLINYVRVRVTYLLKWLNDRGYSDITTESIRVAHMTFTHRNKELLNGLQ